MVDKDADIARAAADYEFDAEDAGKRAARLEATPSCAVGGGEVDLSFAEPIYSVDDDDDHNGENGSGDGGHCEYDSRCRYRTAVLEVEIFRAEKLKLPKTDTGDGGIGDALFAVLDFAGGSVPDKPPQDELYCVLRAGGKRARTPTSSGERKR